MESNSNSNSESQPQSISNDFASDIGNFLQDFSGRDPDRFEKMSVGVEVPSELPGAVQLFNVDYCDIHDDFDVAWDSTYTTTTLTLRSEAESSSTAGPSSNGSTVFSRGTYGQNSSSNNTSNPPRHGQQPTFVQALQRSSPTPPPASTAEQEQQPWGSSRLWCEFCVLRNCTQTYRLDEISEWIAHHSRHMKDTYPAELICWFCDYVPFKAADRAQREANFHSRMEHIRGHIFDEGMTMDDVRPDYFMIKHLHKHRLIPDSMYVYMYNRAMGYSEVPEPLRFPMSSSSSHAIPRTMPPLEEELPPVWHDLGKERRHQRRRGSGRS
ncbi:hypothetical protein QBC33DRAFT_553998 [Phialemonium atrogriseum]|uniref:Uncharacterized protein n=1 Tax=Phialemonium atrogriseum TaxID=1093897 RepID=A0AAJ0CBP8_9PEZI|nr:uncharacterized protein QBC33DRAFT_553998 [Phialemonium atrogriseum]KAK1772548.1 hypothetical protein QBC33DRAFT_553998 [Phialemonium atrogriseum]